jgi:hemerythrin-like domain-containing protein
MASREPIKVDAIFLLEKDHEAVQALFSEFRKFEEEGAKDVDEMKQAIMDDVCSMLKIHAQIEEEIFYPAARECLKDDEELMDEVEAEQDAAKVLVGKIEKGSASNPDTCALFLELSDAIDEHIQEEQDEMFPRVREAGMNTAQIGERLKARKDELEGEAAKAPFEDSPKKSIVDRITSYLGPSV